MRWPGGATAGMLPGGGLIRRLMKVLLLTTLGSLLVPRNVGLSAKGFEYSRGSGGVKKARDGGEYDGISPGSIGTVGILL